MPIIVIAVAVLAIWLYIELMSWMFTNLFADVFIASACIGLLALPIGYWRAARPIFRVGQVPGLRDLLWVPVFLLLGLIYADCVEAVLLSVQSLRLEVQPNLLPLLHEPGGIGSLVWRMPLNAAVIAALREWLPWDADWRLLLLCAATVKVALIVVFLLLSRGLVNSVEDASEPAFKQYFFGQAPRDLGAMVSGILDQTGRLYAGVAALLAVIGPALGVGAIALWPLYLAVALALLVPALVVVAMILGMLAIQGLTLAIIIALSWTVALLLFLIERSILWVRSGYAKCPHAECHEKVPLPVYRCPQCGAMHQRLIPGRCGVFTRVCTCGHRLPTFSWFGKQRLDAFCPHCKKPMHAALYRANLHIPILGGPSTGKTMFMIASTVQLVDGARADLAVDFIEDAQRRDYRSRWEPDFKSGRAAQKTTTLLPSAYLLSLQRRQGLPVSLYLFDPAGEALESELDLQRQRHLKHLGGLVLAIDPLSFPAMADALRETGDSPPPDTSRTPPVDVIARILAALRTHGLGSHQTRFTRPVAVVFTKGDLPIVQQQFGSPLGSTVGGGPLGTVDEALSARIRAWLARHAPDFLQSLETHFTDLRFFLVSAMGHDQRQPGAFQPKRVLEPLLWLLSSRAALARPGLTRWSMAAAETSIVVALVGLFGLVPYAAVAITTGTLRTPVPTWNHPSPGPSQAETPRPPQSPDTTAMSERHPSRSTLPNPVTERRPPAVGTAPAANASPSQNTNDRRSPAAPSLALAPSYGEVTGDGARLRTGPSRNATVAAKVPRGERLLILGHNEDGTWTEVQDPKTKGSLWIFSRLIRLPARQ